MEPSTIKGEHTKNVANLNLICCIGVGPFRQHHVTHGSAVFGVLTHQLKDMSPLRGHIVDVRPVLQRRLQATRVPPRRVDAVEQNP